MVCLINVISFGYLQQFIDKTAKNVCVFLSLSSEMNENARARKAIIVAVMQNQRVTTTTKKPHTAHTKSEQFVASSGTKNFPKSILLILIYFVCVCVQMLRRNVFDTLRIEHGKREKKYLTLFIYLLDFNLCGNCILMKRAIHNTIEV